MSRVPIGIPGITLLALVMTAACSRSRPVRQQSAPEAARPPAAGPVRDAPRDAADRSGADDRAADPAGRAAGARDPGLAALESNIYFDFDRSDLTAEARNALAAKLTVLLANPSLRIEITGHADERGSDEYNLALGLERAAAAKRYLTQRGVAPDRISVASMGEEQPVCTETTESCWWRNRRDEFTITSPASARRP